MGKPAANLTNAIRDYLTLKGWLVWRNQSGGVRKGKHFVRLQATGIPDLMATKGISGVPYAVRPLCLAIEVKATKGEAVSDAQNGWLHSLACAGWHPIVARSLDDVINATKDL